MPKTNHPLEKLIQIITYKGVEFEIVERPDVMWVGCIDYAKNNTDESDVAATLKRFQEMKDIAKKELVNPDWSAALSINYTCGSKPCGLMFANETYSDEQDSRFDLFIQPGGLWLRVYNDQNAAELLLDKEKAEPYEYFAGSQAPLQSAARENGYLPNPEVHVQVEYSCHAEYSTPPHTNYAYIPIIRA